MELEYAKVSAVGDRTDNQDRAAVVVADEAALMMVFAPAVRRIDQ